MMSKKVWNLMYVAGNPAMFSRVTSCTENPMPRADAIAGAEKIAKNGWRVWVEHHQTGRRIFESVPEQQHKASQEAKRVIEFAEANVPGFAAARG